MIWIALTVALVFVALCWLSVRAGRLHRDPRDEDRD